MHFHTTYVILKRLKWAPCTNLKSISIQLYNLPVAAFLNVQFFVIRTKICHLHYLLKLTLITPFIKKCSFFLNFSTLMLHYKLAA